MKTTDKSKPAANDTQRRVPARQPLSRRKRFIFAFIAICLGMGFIGAAEGVLRICGFGGYKPVIREVGKRDGKSIVVTEAMGAATYFYSKRSKSGSIFETTFLKPKPPATTRIMLMGESAAKGYPEPPPLAASSFLRAMLSDVWPNRNVEVLNLGCTAIASFPVRGILTEAIEYEPDLVIVYCGNNEFFGAYGVASLHSAGDSVTAMQVQRWVRGLALSQVIDRFLAGPKAGPDMALMERMIGQTYTAPDDPKRDSAARNIYTNVAAMIDICQSRGVPIIVCNSPVNERDLAPLGDDDVSSLPQSLQNELAMALGAATTLIKSDAIAALKELKRFDGLPVPSARLKYSVGRALYALGKFPESAAAFQEAVELDSMPWRATKKSNDSIEHAAREGGATLCNLADVFRKASPGGSVGWELMDDHVHPSLQGQDLIARAIVQSMVNASGPLAVDAIRANSLPTWQEYAARLGDNEYERYGAAHTIRVLAGIPFIRKTNPGMHERFDTMARQFEQRMDPDVLKVAHDWQKPETHLGGTQRPISGMVARARIKQGRFEEAEKLSDFAVRCVPPYCSWSLEFAYFRLVSRQRVRGKLDELDRQVAQDAIERGRFLMNNGIVGTGLTERYIGRLHQLRDEWAEAIPYLQQARKKLSGSDLVAADQALVESYARTGDREAAKQIIMAGEVNPDYGGIYSQMRQAFLDKPR